MEGTRYRPQSTKKVGFKCLCFSSKMVISACFLACSFSLFCVGPGVESNYRNYKYSLFSVKKFGVEGIKGGYKYRALYMCLLIELIF